MADPLIGEVWRGGDGYPYRVVALTPTHAWVRYAYSSTAPAHLVLLAWFKEWTLVTPAACHG